MGRTGIDDRALSVTELKVRNRVRLVVSLYDDQVLLCVHVYLLFNRNHCGQASERGC